MCAMLHVILSFYVTEKLLRTTGSLRPPQHGVVGGVVGTDQQPGQHVYVWINFLTIHFSCPQQSQLDRVAVAHAC